MSYQHSDPSASRNAVAGTAAWGLALVVVALAQLALSSPILKEYDEGLILTGASRVADGAVPYRDFWSMYGPGSFYALAGLDRLFGESVLVGRCFDAAARAAIVLLVVALVARPGRRRLAAVAGLAVFAMLLGVRDYLFPALPATAGALLALLCAGRALRTGAGPAGRRLEWAAAGAAVGLAGFFRHDFGGFAMAACLWAMYSGHDPQRPGPARFWPRLRGFAAGLGVVVVPFSAWIVTQVPLQDLYENLFGIPLRVYVAYRALPFPSVAEVVRASMQSRAVAPVYVLAAYLPIVAAALAIGAIAVARARGHGGGPRLAHFEAMTLLCVLFTLKGALRAQWLHVLPAAIVGIVLVALLLAQLRWRLGTFTQATIAAGVAVAGIGAALTRDAAPALVLTALHGCRPAHGPRLGCFSVDDDRAEVLDFLSRRALPADRLYVGAGRHDKLFVGNVELYFLSGLVPATKWHDLHPGVQTTRRAQQDMIAEMTRRPPDFVVLNSEWDDWAEPNQSSRSSGVTDLDEFLRARFVPVFVAGTFTVSVPPGRAAAMRTPLP